MWCYQSQYLNQVLGRDSFCQLRVATASDLPWGVHREPARLPIARGRVSLWLLLSQTSQPSLKGFAWLGQARLRQTVFWSAWNQLIRSLIYNAKTPSPLSYKKTFSQDWYTSLVSYSIFRGKSHVLSTPKRMSLHSDVFVFPFYAHISESYSVLITFFVVFFWPYLFVSTLPATNWERWIYLPQLMFCFPGIPAVVAFKMLMLHSSCIIITVMMMLGIKYCPCKVPFFITDVHLLIYNPEFNHLPY